MVGYASTSSSDGAEAAAARAALAPAVAAAGLEGLWVLEVYVGGRPAGRGRIEFGPAGTMRGIANPFLVALRGFLVGNCAMASLVRTEGRSYEYRFVDLAPDTCGEWTTVTECRFELDETGERFTGEFVARTFDATWNEVEATHGTHVGNLTRD